MFLFKFLGYLFFIFFICINLDKWLVLRICLFIGIFFNLSGNFILFLIFIFGNNLKFWYINFIFLFFGGKFDIKFFLYDIFFLVDGYFFVNVFRNRVLFDLLVFNKIKYLWLLIFKLFFCNLKLGKLRDKFFIFNILIFINFFIKKYFKKY